MNFSSIYKINYDKLITWLLPTFLRQTKLFRWLQALIAPIKLLYNDFLNYQTYTIYKLSHNSQVCYLQKVLNDAFDANLKRIHITNGIFLQPLYIYTQAEQRPVYLEQQHIYTENDFSQAQPDFIIAIPAALKPITPNQLKDYTNTINIVVNTYKLASKTYTIQWIN